MTRVSRIIPTAEPFFLKGNDTFCILIHGFTGSPKEMRWLGEYLNKNSYSVIAPRLPGHATDPKDMKRIKWKDWVSSIEDIYNYCKPNAQKIFIIGLSMGGILASYSSAYLSYNGLITISTPYEFPQKDWRLPFVRILSVIKPRIDKGSGDWQNKEAEVDHIDYPFYPTKSIAELRDLIIQYQQVLPSLSLPSLHIHSTKDQSVPYHHLDNLFHHNGSSKKQMFTVENSGHVIIREPDRFLVFERILNFIKEN